MRIESSGDRAFVIDVVGSDQIWFILGAGGDKGKVIAGGYYTKDDLAKLRDGLTKVLQ